MWCLQTFSSNSFSEKGNETVLFGKNSCYYYVYYFSRFHSFKKHSSNQSHTFSCHIKTEKNHIIKNDKLHHARVSFILAHRGAL